VDNPETPAFEVSPAEVQQRISAGERLFLIDVREPDEYQLTRLPGAELIPMGTVPSRLGHLEELAEEGVLIVYCHHGMRSANVVNWLRGQGVTACQNLSGGIDRWSIEVDPSTPRY
jgi:rhodanese-related sulfurtransferase